MSTRYNTGNPIESTDVRDMSDNAKNLDLFSNSSELSFADRLGVERQTIYGMNSEFNDQILNMGFSRVGTFSSGATLTNPRQTLLWNTANGGDGQEYGWSGTFPKIVPPSSTPSSTGGISVGAWMSRFDPELRIMVRESLRRSYAEAGYKLVDGSFEAGGTLINVNDVLLQESTGKVFSGPAGAVDAGTAPTSGGFVDESGALLRNDLEAIRVFRTTTESGCVGDGVTADRAAFLQAVADTPVGGTLKIIGFVRLEAETVITKRISLWCDSYDDALIVNPGPTNNGLVFNGPAAGINGVNTRLNVYGPANACKNAVILTRVDRSKIDLNVRCGAVEYGTILDGCLINNINLVQSVNYTPPYVGAGVPTDHLLVRKNATHSVATNANNINVLFEGSRHGVVNTAQSNEGGNNYYGTIEGLSGRPLDITNNRNVHIHDLWMEANAMKSRFIDCITPRIGAGVQIINTGDAAGTPNEIDFVNCRGVVFDGPAYGGANFDTACIGQTIGAASMAYDGKIIGEGKGHSAETVGPVVSSDTIARPNQMFGGFGESTQENLFHNPFVDIWTLGAAANPDGMPPVKATSVRVNSPLYPRHGSRYSNHVTVTVAGLANGAHIVPKAPYITYTEDRWISFAIAVYVTSGQPDVRVFAIGGILLGTVTTKDEFVVVRGSCFVAANTPLEFWATCYNKAGSVYVTGEYYIGAVNIVNGYRVPKYFGDHGKRSEHIVTSVSFAPAFVGQRAYLSGTQKWYMAAGTASAADWIILN